MPQAEQSWVHIGSCMPMEEVTSVSSSGATSPSCCNASLAIFNALIPTVREEVVSSAVKIELHSVLNAFQCSPVYGVHVCESFKDPRKHCMDDYWDEVEFEAFSVNEMHTLVGGAQRKSPPGQELSHEARAKLHQFSRVLQRLSKRIDRIVLGTAVAPTT